MQERSPAYPCPTVPEPLTGGVPGEGPALEVQPDPVLLAADPAGAYLEEATVGEARAVLAPVPRMEAPEVRSAPRPLPPPKPAPSARRAIMAVAMLLDCTLIWLAFCTAYYLRYVVRWVPVERNTLFIPFRDWIPFGIVFSLILLASLVVSGFYRTRLSRDLLDELLVVFRVTLVGVGLVAILTTFLPVILYSRLVIVYAWVVVMLYLTLGKAVLYGALGRLHGNGWNTRRVLVAGTTPLSKMVMQNLLAKRQQGYYLVGFVQEARPVPGGKGGYPPGSRGDFGRFKCLGSVLDLRDVVRAWSVDEVIVALPATHHAEIADVCSLCDEAQVAVKLVPDLFEMSLSRVRMDHLAGIPLIDVHRTGRSRAATLTKRAMDIVIASLVLLILSPILLLTALAIRLDSPGPIILTNQRRVGKDRRLFTFYKFRSMYVDAEQRLAALKAEKGIVDARIFKDRRDPRRTRVGRIIRTLSIDELPQLFNVLKGDMSLVGPRPPLPAEVEKYEPHHLKRLTVIGGITGMWQVSGRSNIESFEEIIIMDNYYIDNWSLGLDLKILLRTVLAVISRTGAY